MTERAQYFDIDSRDRVSGTATNFTVLLENLAVPNPFNRVSLASLSVNKAYYLIDTAHHTFSLDENGSVATVTLTIGNYSFDTLATELKTQLNAAGQWTYTCEGDERIGKYDFTVSGNGGLQPEFTFTTGLAEILGFEEDTYAFVADALQSPNMVNLQKTVAILIWTNLCAENNGILERINASSNDYNAIVYSNPNHRWTGSQLAARGTTAAEFRVLDFELKEVLSLNGHHVHMTIALWRESPLPALEFQRLRQDYLLTNAGLDSATQLGHILTTLQQILDEMRAENAAKRQKIVQNP